MIRPSISRFLLDSSFQLGSVDGQPPSELESAAYYLLEA